MTTPTFDSLDGDREYACDVELSALRLPPTEAEAARAVAAMLAGLGFDPETDPAFVAECEREWIAADLAGGDDEPSSFLRCCEGR